MLHISIQFLKVTHIGKNIAKFTHLCQRPLGSEPMNTENSNLLWNVCVWMQKLSVLVTEAYKDAHQKSVQVRSQFPGHPHSSFNLACDWKLMLKTLYARG